ncbi:hypothetical protein SBBP1_1270002 [Burkholderiales bacterium]|nr:hypothetical protein SBBP1_1270002 [Burkholderiales bacterium]
MRGMATRGGRMAGPGWVRCGPRLSADLRSEPISRTVADVHDSDGAVALVDRVDDPVSTGSSAMK